MDVREKILSLTTEFFQTNGCRKVTMDEIASYIGMSKRTIYENFPDKNALVWECLKYVNEQIHNRFMQYVNEEESFENILTVIHSDETGKKMMSTVRFMKEVKQYYPSVYRSVAPKLNEYRLKNKKLILQKARQEGMVSADVDIDLQASIIEGMMSAVESFEEAGETSTEKRNAYKTMMITYFRGLSTERGREMIDNFIDNCKQKR